MARRLRLSFRDAKSFLEEYRRNIAVGGAFVRTGDDFEPRETVCVELELTFCGASLDLEAEVVHRVPPRPDAPDAAGVAVQFHLAADELRRRLDRHARAAEGMVSPGPETPATGASQTAAPASKKLGREKKAPISREEIRPRREVRTPALAMAPKARPAPTPPSAQRTSPPPPPSPAPAPAPRAAVAAEPEAAPIPGEDLEILLAEMSAEEGGQEREESEARSGGAFDPTELVLDDPGDEMEGPAGTDAAVDDTDGTWDPFERDASVELGAAAPEPASGAEWELEDEDPPADESPLAEDDWTQPDPHAAASAAGDRSIAEDEDDDDDRRRDRRETARVPVRLDATHVSLDGRTRDLSESGLLVSVDGTELPIGKAVAISLVHPETGEALEVRGRVARHVPADGTVAAVGIRFEPEEGEGPELAERVRELKAAERERRRRGISGALDEIGMVNLLQALARCSPRGTLTVVSGSEEGVMAFEDGFLCYARIGSLRGEKALARLLGWQEGWFDFHARVDAMPGQDAPVLLEAAILEAARQLDEACRDENASFDPAAKLRVDMNLLTREHFDLDKTEQAVIDLAVAGFTIRRILDVIPEADSVVLDALRSLQDRGLVQLA